MNSSIPEDFLLHHSGGSSPGPTGSPEGLLPRRLLLLIFTVCSRNSKTAGLRESFWPLHAQLSPGQGASAVQPGFMVPQPSWGQLGGCAPAFGKGTPVVRGAALGPLPSPSMAEEQVLCPGRPGGCANIEVTPNLCPAWPHERVC